jgi:hypothetical protein
MTVQEKAGLPGIINQSEKYTFILKRNTYFIIIINNVIIIYLGKKKK